MATKKTVIHTVSMQSQMNGFIRNLMSMAAAVMGLAQLSSTVRSLLVLRFWQMIGYMLELLSLESFFLLALLLLVMVTAFRKQLSDRHCADTTNSMNEEISSLEDQIPEESFEIEENQTEFIVNRVFKDAQLETEEEEEEDQTSMGFQQYRLQQQQQQQQPGMVIDSHSEEEKDDDDDDDDELAMAIQLSKLQQQEEEEFALAIKQSRLEQQQHQLRLQQQEEELLFMAIQQSKSQEELLLSTVQSFICDGNPNPDHQKFFNRGSVNINTEVQELNRTPANDIEAAFGENYNEEEEFESVDELNRRVEAFISKVQRNFLQERILSSQFV